MNSYSRKYKRLHFNEIEVLINLCEEVEEDDGLSEPERGAYNKLREIRAAMIRKREKENELAKRIVSEEIASNKQLLSSEK
jgi:hypothetical protein